jgi:hypothetical protein
MLERLGNLEKALLIDDYAEDKDTGIIDLVLIGDLDPKNLQYLTIKTEKYVDRKIKTLALTADEFKKLAPKLDERPQFILCQIEHIND